MPRPRGRRRGSCRNTEAQQGQAAHTARHHKHPEGPTGLLLKGKLRLLMQGVVFGALVKGAQARVPTEGDSAEDGAGCAESGRPGKEHTVVPHTITATLLCFCVAENAVTHNTAC